MTFFLLWNQKKIFWKTWVFLSIQLKITWFNVVSIQLKSVWFNIVLDPFDSLYRQKQLKHCKNVCWKKVTGFELHKGESKRWQKSYLWETNQIQIIFLVLNNHGKVLSSKTFILKTKELSRTAYQFSIQQETNKSDNGNPSLIVSAFASPAWKRLSNPAILLHKSERTKTLQLSRIIDNRCLAWVFENQEETSEADWNIICRHVASSWRDSRAKTKTVALSFHL